MNSAVLVVLKALQHGAAIGNDELVIIRIVTPGAIYVWVDLAMPSSLAFSGRVAVFALGLVNVCTVQATATWTACNVAARIIWTAISRVWNAVFHVDVRCTKRSSRTARRISVSIIRIFGNDGRWAVWWRWRRRFGWRWRRVWWWRLRRAWRRLGFEDAQSANDLVLAFVVWIKREPVTAIWRVAIGKANEVDALCNTSHGNGDALVEKLGGASERTLFKPRKSQVGKVVGSFGTSSYDQTFVLHQVVGEKARRRQRAVSRVGKR